MKKRLLIVLWIALLAYLGLIWHTTAEQQCSFSEAIYPTRWAACLIVAIAILVVWTLQYVRIRRDQAKRAAKVILVVLSCLTAAALMVAASVVIVDYHRDRGGNELSADQTSPLTNGLTLTPDNTSSKH